MEPVPSRRQSPASDVDTNRRRFTLNGSGRFQGGENTSFPHLGVSSQPAQSPRMYWCLRAHNPRWWKRALNAKLGCKGEQRSLGLATCGGGTSRDLPKVGAGRVGDWLNGIADAEEAGFLSRQQKVEMSTVWRNRDRQRTGFGVWVLETPKPSPPRRNQ